MIANILLLILLAITFVVYKTIVHPKIRMMLMKRKYGDKIEVVHHYGTGLLMEYRKGYKEKNDSMDFMRKMSAKHTNKILAFAFNIGGKVGFSFIDPELTKQVHQNHDAFQKIDVSQAIIYLFSNSLLYARGKEWARQRQFLGKSFHFEEIRNYLPSIKEVCQRVSEQKINELKEDSKKEVQVVKICESVTSEVVFRVFFGATSENIFIKQEDGSQLHVSQELVSIIMDSFRMLQNNKLLLLKNVILKRYSLKVLPTKEEKKLLNRLVNLRETCRNVVLKRKEELMKDSTRYKKNFLDLYLKDMLQNGNEDITIDEIIDNFSALFFAGTDTTGNMTGVALYYLSRYPAIQEKARNEIMNILSSKTKSKNPTELFECLSFEDLSSLNLINAILKESLRLVPPAIGVFPRYANRDIKIGEFELKKGDLVNTHFIYGQSNPSVYENPDAFNPERWLNGKEQQNVFNFTPFSLGPRNCIGQHLAMIEGKCMLANFLLNFDILPNYSLDPKFEMKIIYGLQPDNLVFFKPRQ